MKSHDKEVKKFVLYGKYFGVIKPKRIKLAGWVACTCQLFCF